MGFEDTAYRYAVKNAFLHNGRADIAAVVGKVMALHKDIQAGKAMPKIKQIVDDVNSKTKEEIEKEYKKFEEKYELKPKPKQEGLKELEWGEQGEQVVTRFAPNPSGPMHLGHCRAALYSYWYAEKYKGKFLLRFDDTDPKIKKPVKEARDNFLEDLGWLGVKKIDKIFLASDRLDKYYDLIKKLIEMEKAYICECKTADWREKAKQCKACECRKKGIEWQMEKWKKMLGHELKEGSAVVRLKTNLKHKDPSQRDWWMAKIVDEPDHTNPKTKNKHVWPSYNLASAVDDHDMGVTLVIRGQEHSQNETKQKFLYDYMEWEYPKTIHYGRIKVEGLELSKSNIAKGIKEGKFSGLEDPRIGTIQMMRKKGFEAEAITKIIMYMGLRPNDASISIDALYNANRKLIDEKSDRLGFVQEPAKVEVQFCQRKEARIPVHPDFAERGEKIYSLKDGSQGFIVEKKELQELKVNETFRLRNAYNVKITDKKEDVVYAQFVSLGKINKKTVHWLLEENMLDIEVIMPDSSKEHGYTEEYGLEKQQGEHVLLEKFGYCLVESIGPRLLRCYYTHR